MHMFSRSSSRSILDGDSNYQARALFEEIKPELWPIPLSELPPGSALVGGAVRDALLGISKEKPDLDFVVPSQAIEIAKNFANNFAGTFVLLDPKREIARVVLNGWTLDIANQEGSCLKEDLVRRDFRVNAIALSWDPVPSLIDPTGGMEDLRNKQLVAVSETNLICDPLRCLRAFRLMAELNFNLDIHTKKIIEENGSLLSDIASERIQSELQRLVNARWASKVIPLLEETELLAFLKVKKHDHLIKQPSIDRSSIFTSSEKALALSLSRLTYLLDDENLTRLRFSRRQCKRCKSLRYWQSRNDGVAFEGLQEAERLKLHQDLEEDLPALIIQLPLENQSEWIKRWRNPDDPLFHPSSPIDGTTLQDRLNLPSNIELGRLIRHLTQEKAFGRLSNIDEALHAAHRWCDDKYTLL